MEKPVDLPDSIKSDVDRVNYRLLSGNPAVPGCPLVYGWIFRLRRYTTSDERAWLKANGWGFSGGKWIKPDDGNRAGLMA